MTYWVLTYWDMGEKKEETFHGTMAGVRCHNRIIDLRRRGIHYYTARRGEANVASN